MPIYFQLINDCIKHIVHIVRVHNNNIVYYQYVLQVSPRLLHNVVRYLTLVWSIKNELIKINKFSKIYTYIVPSKLETKLRQDWYLHNDIKA